MYEAFLKRKTIEDASQIKAAMISGLWANTNLDDGKDTRQKALTDIEESFQRAVNYIYNGTTEEEEYRKMLEEPFFAAIDKSDNSSDAPSP